MANKLPSGARLQTRRMRDMNSLPCGSCGHSLVQKTIRLFDGNKIVHEMRVNRESWQGTIIPQKPRKACERQRLLLGRTTVTPGSVTMPLSLKCPHCNQPWSIGIQCSETHVYCPNCTKRLMEPII